MFKRDGIYYVLAGTGCCACIGGSTIYVMMAKSLAGPWTYAGNAARYRCHLGRILLKMPAISLRTGDVGSNPTPFDPHSPNNYVSRHDIAAIWGCILLKMAAISLLTGDQGAGQLRVRGERRVHLVREPVGIWPGGDAAWAAHA